MTVRKSLENRIRGWFPQEPNLPSRNSPVQKLENPKIPQYTSIGRGVENSPYLLTLFLPLIIIINFLVGYDVILQYLARGIPPVSTRLDMWFTAHYFGSFNPSNYVTVLSVFYLFSLFVGITCSLALLSSLFQNLFRNNSVTLTMRRFMVCLLDVFVGIAIIGFMVNPILEYASGYPSGIGAALGTSTISFYMFAGFVTGSILMKVLFPFGVFIRSRRRHLNLIVESLRLGSKVESKYPNAIRWTLQPKEQCFIHPNEDAGK